jgi:hypothetical protein
LRRKNKTENSGTVLKLISPFPHFISFFVVVVSGGGADGGAVQAAMLTDADVCVDVC